MIKELSTEEFQKYVDSCNNVSIYQLPGYAFTMNKENYDCVFLGFIENDTVKGAALLLVENKLGIKIGFCPRGYIIDYTNASLVSKFTREIKKYLNRVNISVIRINPPIIKQITDYNNNVIYTNENYKLICSVLAKSGYHHLGYNDFFESLKPRFESVLILGKDEQQLFKNMKKSFRTKIRGAENDGVKIHKGDIDDLNLLYLQTKSKYPRDLKYFKELYNNFYKKELIDFYYAKLDTRVYLENSRLNYEKNEVINSNLSNQLMDTNMTNKSAILTAKMASDVILEKCKNKLIEATNLLRIFPDGLVLASALIVRNKNRIHLVMDGFDSRYKHISGKHLLFWNLIKYYNQMGYKEFDLGGTINPFKSHPKYNGLKEFKNCFGTQTSEYIGDVELIINPLKYLIFNHKTKKSN